MSIAAQAKTISDSLQGWFDQLGTGNGKSAVVYDMAHMWNMLFNGPKTLKALTLYMGEESRETFVDADIMGRIDRSFITVITRGRSFNLDRGSSLTDDTVAGEPLFDLVEQARDVIRTVILEQYETERPINYKRTIPFPTENTGLIIDAYQIEYVVGVQIPIVSSIPDNLAIV